MEKELKPVDVAERLPERVAERVREAMAPIQQDLQRQIAKQSQVPRLPLDMSRWEVRVTLRSNIADVEVTPPDGGGWWLVSVTAAGNSLDIDTFFTWARLRKAAP